jgi:hypothetical protein
MDTNYLRLLLPWGFLPRQAGDRETRATRDLSEPPKLRMSETAGIAGIESDLSAFGEMNVPVCNLEQQFPRANVPPQLCKITRFFGLCDAIGGIVQP